MYFLNLEIFRSTQDLSLSQRKYYLQILEDTSFLNSKPEFTPMDSNLKLTKATRPFLYEEKAIGYRRLSGCLLYLQISWQDISFVIN